MSSAKNKSHFKAIIHHPVQIERIPHIVSAVTVMYMFAFLFLSIGFLSASTKTQPTPIQQQNTLIPAQQETVDFFPVEFDQPSDQEQDFYYDQPYNQEDVLGQEVDDVFITQDQNQIYPYQYAEPNNDPYLNQNYYDEDYYNYWEEDLGDNTHYQNTQQADLAVTDVYLTQPTKTTFASRLSSTASGESLLFVGFSVLAMGILVFFVNHIHDNNHFSHKPHHKISKIK